MTAAARAATRGIVLCEDKLTERFLRQLLASLGFDTRHRMRFDSAPSGKGAAEAWVRKRYPREVRLLRAKRHQRDLCLVAVRDGDCVGVTKRKLELDHELELEDLQPRQAGERIATPVPTWSIETWLLALLGDAELPEDVPGKPELVRRHGGREREVVIAAVRAWSEGGASRSGVPSPRDGASELERVARP